MDTTETIPEGASPPDDVRDLLEALRPPGYVRALPLGVRWGGVVWWALVWRRSVLRLEADPRTGYGQDAGPELLGAVTGRLDAGDPSARLPHAVPLEVLALIGAAVGGLGVSLLLPPAQALPGYYRPSFDDDVPEGWTAQTLEQRWPLIRFGFFPVSAVAAGAAS